MQVSRICMLRQIALVSTLIVASCQAQTTDASLTYQFSWGGLAIAQINDQLKFSEQRYVIESDLTTVNWLSILDIPSLKRTVSGTVSSAQKLQPNLYNQRHGSRHTDIQFNYAARQIIWQDTKRGFFTTTLPDLGAYDTLSSMYLFYAAGQPTEKFKLHFVDNKRLRTYEFQSDLVPVEIETAAGDYTALRYDCATKPVTIWYAGDLNWIPIKASIGTGIQRFSIELAAASFST